MLTTGSLVLSIVRISLAPDQRLPVPDLKGEVRTEPSRRHGSYAVRSAWLAIIPSARCLSAARQLRGPIEAADGEHAEHEYQQAPDGYPELQPRFRFAPKHLHGLP